MKKSMIAAWVVSLFLQGHALGQAPNAARASEGKILKVRPLPLNSVRLTGGPLKHAQELDAEYLLQLEPDRMLAYLRQRAGLQPKGWLPRRLMRGDESDAKRGLK